MIGYAEIHYKFRLPWSPLWRSRPEVVADAPHTALPGQVIPVWLVIHDAHLHPCRLAEVRILVRQNGRSFVWRRESWNLPLDQPSHLVPLEWPGPDEPGIWTADVAFLLVDRRGRSTTWLNHNLPGLPSWPLVVERLAEPFPFPDGWAGGDLHVHSTWSRNPVEIGGDLTMLRAASRCLGLHWFCCTDHSYDFAWKDPDYTRPADPDERFATFRNSFEEVHPGDPVVLPCEEVSCSNREGRNVHLLVVDHPEYLPGQGDGGRRWLRNRPDLSVADVLERSAASSAPCYAAHPAIPDTIAQRLAFRRGPWRDHDFLPGLHGVQFWNGEPDGTDFVRGRALWLRALQRGLPLRAAAASDAHGDLNRTTAVALPLWSLRQTRRHCFGRARTWLHLPPHPDRAAVRQGLRDAPEVLSDGPFLELQTRQGKASWTAQSIEAFGNLSSVRLTVGLPGATRETVVTDLSPASLFADGGVDLPAGALWVRAEARTTLGRTALTGARPLC